jgi:hypothetical protein
MENSKRNYQDILQKLQESLNEFKCKSEIKISDKEAILYGKFSLESEKHTIVIHLKEEGYVPLTGSAKKVETKFESVKKSVMPSLEYQYNKSPISYSNQDEQIVIKNTFIDDANEIGREYLKKMKK